MWLKCRRTFWGKKPSQQYEETPETGSESSPAGVLRYLHHNEPTLGQGNTAECSCVKAENAEFLMEALHFYISWYKK